jgi:hypothetical protein
VGATDLHSLSAPAAVVVMYENSAQRRSSRLGIVIEHSAHASAADRPNAIGEASVGVANDRNRHPETKSSRFDLATRVPAVYFLQTHLRPGVALAEPN